MGILACFVGLKPQYNFLIDKYLLLLIQINDTSGLYYKHITIVNDHSGIGNKFQASLTDEARVFIYNGHMFIVEATDL